MAGYIGRPNDEVIIRTGLRYLVESIRNGATPSLGWELGMLGECHPLSQHTELSIQVVAEVDLSVGF